MAKLQLPDAKKEFILDRPLMMASVMEDFFRYDACRCRDKCESPGEDDSCKARFVTQVVDDISDWLKHEEIQSQPASCARSK